MADVWLWIGDAVYVDEQEVYANTKNRAGLEKVIFRKVFFDGGVFTGDFSREVPPESGAEISSQPRDLSR